jgi:hypothetical protein
MVKQVASTKGFTNKLKTLFYRPGWHPEEQGGFQGMPPLDPKPKFDVHPQTKMIRYIFLQFILILAFTAVFLFTYSNYDPLIKWLMAGYILWSIAQLGLMMENRKFWLSIEPLRIIATAAIIYSFMPTINGIISLVGHLIIFGSWFYLASKNQVRSSPIT